MGGVRRIPSVLTAATAQARNVVLSTTVSTAMPTLVGLVMLVRLASFEWAGFDYGVEFGVNVLLGA